MPEKLTYTSNKEKKRIVRELLSTGKVERVIDSPIKKLPEVPEGLSSLAKTGLEAIDRFLTMPLVFDKKDAFSGHKERRFWRTELPLPQREVYEHNALRGNSANAAFFGAQLVMGGLKDKRFQKQEEKLRKRYTNGWDEESGKKFSLEQKRAFIEKELRPFLLELRQQVLSAKTIAAE